MSEEHHRLHGQHGRGGSGRPAEGLLRVRQTIKEVLAMYRMVHFQHGSGEQLDLISTVATTPTHTQTVQDDAFEFQVQFN